MPHEQIFNYEYAFPPTSSVNEQTFPDVQGFSTEAVNQAVTNSLLANRIFEDAALGDTLNIWALQQGIKNLPFVISPDYTFLKDQGELHSLNTLDLKWLESQDKQDSEVVHQMSFVIVDGIHLGAYRDDRVGKTAEYRQIYTKARENLADIEVKLMNPMELTSGVPVFSNDMVDKIQTYASLKLKQAVFSFNARRSLDNQINGAIGDLSTIPLDKAA